MTNYFSFQHFRKMNVRFMLLKKISIMYETIRNNVIYLCRISLRVR